MKTSLFQGDLDSRHHSSPWCFQCDGDGSGHPQPLPRSLLDGASGGVETALTL